MAKGEPVEDLQDFERLATSHEPTQVSRHHTLMSVKAKASHRASWMLTDRPIVFRSCSRSCPRRNPERVPHTTICGFAPPTNAATVSRLQLQDHRLRKRKRPRTANAAANAKAAATRRCCSSPIPSKSYSIRKNLIARQRRIAMKSRATHSPPTTHTRGLVLGTPTTTDASSSNLGASLMMEVQPTLDPTFPSWPRTPGCLTATTG